MKHRGQLLKNAIEERGFKITKLAKLLNVSPRTFYDWFKKEDLNIETLFKVGKHMNYDFAPEISSYKAPFEALDKAEENKEGYEALSECKKDRAKYLNLYLVSLERENALLTRVNQLLESKA